MKWAVAYISGDLCGDGQLFEGKVLLARPCINDRQISHQLRADDRIFCHWQQLDRTATFTNCVLLVAQNGVSHPEHTERFRIGCCATSLIASVLALVNAAPAALASPLI